MACLSASVARLAGGAQRTSVGRGTVPADVAELAASVALHCLSLTIPSVVVGPTALVASSGPATAESSTASEPESSTSDGCSPTESACSRAVASQVAGVAAAVASSSSAGSGKPQSRAIGLNVSETLTVVALFGIRSPGLGANIGLMARLLAVVAETLRRSADLREVSDGTALVTSSPGQRHDR